MLMVIPLSSLYDFNYTHILYCLANECLHSKLGKSLKMFEFCHKNWSQLYLLTKYF